MILGLFDGFDHALIQPVVLHSAILALDVGEDREADAGQSVGDSVMEVLRPEREQIAAETVVACRCRSDWCYLYEGHMPR